MNEWMVALMATVAVVIAAQENKFSNKEYADNDNCVQIIYPNNVIQFPTADSSADDIDSIDDSAVGNNGTVDPIKDKADIELFKQYFLKTGNLRNYMLFVVGINVGLRAGDLLSLKVGDVVNQVGERNYECKLQVRLKEQKTNKHRMIWINEAAQEAIKLYLDSQQLNSQQTDNELDEYLFKSREGDNKPLTVGHVARMLREAAKELGITYPVGTHSLRKTWAYHIFMSHRDDAYFLSVLQQMLNHSSSAITLRYIGITQDVIKNVYMDGGL